MLLVWMFPSHKLFDHALLLAGIWVATRLIERPMRAEVITAGLFGRGCAPSPAKTTPSTRVRTTVVLLLLFFKRRKEMARYWVVFWNLGLAAGLLPLMVMLLWAPGFATSYQLSIAEIFRHGANLTLPFPWPWRSFFRGEPLSLGRS